MFRLIGIDQGRQHVDAIPTSNSSAKQAPAKADLAIETSGKSAEANLAGGGD
jgi:hypothetical protein